MAFPFAIRTQILRYSAIDNLGWHEVSENNDLIKLYSGRILALAADIPHAERLDNPQGSAKHRSPLCGSTVTVDLERHVEI